MNQQNFHLLKLIKINLAPFHISERIIGLSYQIVYE